MNQPSLPSQRILTPNTPALRETAKAAFAVRIADIKAKKPDGSIVIGQRKVPTLADFDQPFAAFAQGTVFKSDTGFIAVEDLHPGDRLMTAEGDCEEVTWIGSAVFGPGDQGPQMSLTRVMPDSFGVNRPENFASFGPAARLLQAPPNLRGSTAAARLMTPASRFLDNVNVVPVLPPSPVRLFHVAVHRHAALIANGLHVESYHPGYTPVSHMSQTLQNVFGALFPHVEDLTEFGPMQFARAPEAGDFAEAL
jgi:hypothetical protein